METPLSFRLFQMRTPISFLIWCIFAQFLFSSCQKTSHLSISSPVAYTATQDYVMDNGLLVPKGSTTWIEQNTLHIRFPDSYRFIDWASTTDNSGRLVTKAVELQEVQVNCTCESGSGCSPFTNGTYSGCITQNNSCTKCVMTTSASIDGAKWMLHVRKGDVLDLSAQPALTSFDPHDLASPPAYDAMFESDTVRHLLTAFLKEYVSPMDAALLKNTDIDHLPSHFYIIPVEFLGHILYVPMNAENRALRDDPLIYLFKTGGIYYPREENYTCSCSAGGSGCSLHHLWYPGAGSIYYCDAQDCTDCTLK
ncbi:MAG: hypothetical protein IMW88_10720 [Thermoflavifilum sp.]|uniref:hypothetical protein n=1 Tax=Thermoflavifilum sp. TaxID=1968839 RepID=UPI0018A44074|nr:hypothetical protein [Thermoflavifilum sp.]QOR75775.1 MAG: hypothetical protein IMW88_10720 [Thermoflavifilum sp.]